MSQTDLATNARTLIALRLGDGKGALPAAPADLAGARANESDARAFSDLIDRLGARFGTRRVQRLVFHDTHVPEFAGQTQPAGFARAPVPQNLILRSDPKDRVSKDGRNPHASRRRLRLLLSMRAVDVASYAPRNAMAI